MYFKHLVHVYIVPCLLAYAGQLCEEMDLCLRAKSRSRFLPWTRIFSRQPVKNLEPFWSSPSPTNKENMAQSVHFCEIFFLILFNVVIVIVLM